MKAKKLAEEVAKNDETHSQDGDRFFEKKNGEKTCYEEQCDRREFLIFVRFVKNFDFLEEKDVYFLREEPQQIERQEQEYDRSDQDESVSDKVGAITTGLASLHSADGRTPLSEVTRETVSPA